MKLLKFVKKTKTVKNEKIVNPKAKEKLLIKLISMDNFLIGGEL